MRESSASAMMRGLLTARIQILGSTAAPSVREKTWMRQAWPRLAENWKVWGSPGVSRMPLRAAGSVAGVGHGDGQAGDPGCGPFRLPHVTLGYGETRRTLAEGASPKYSKLPGVLGRAMVSVRSPAGSPRILAVSAV